MKRRLGVTAFVAAAGIAEIAFAVQIRTWHGRGSWTGDPENKLFVASWLASEMWVNVGLLLAGATTLVFALVLYLLYPRLAKRKLDSIVGHPFEEHPQADRLRQSSAGTTFHQGHQGDNSAGGDADRLLTVFGEARLSSCSWS